MITFGIKRRIEAEYARRLGRIFNFINRSIVGLSVADAAQKIVAILSTPEFDKLVSTAVVNMVTMVKAQNERSWRAAASRGSYGREIYRHLKSEVSRAKMDTVIRDIVNENALLIKTVPRDTAKRITNRVYEMTLKGYRVPKTMAYVRAEAPWLTSAQARLIARTESAKANAALTEARSREVDAEWYIWRTSKDERVRSSHWYMEGVLVHWDADPNPELLNGEKNRFGNYHAGCCPNCRCYAEPLIDVIQLPNIVRVSMGGASIKTMGKLQFMRSIGKEEVA